MLIYIEKQAKNYPQTKKILDKFSKAQVIFIDNYKNLFDKSYENISSQKSLIIAKLNSPAITEAPEGYGHTKNAYFFKTSLNCIFDCSYCYLKGLFKNDHMVIFVNYEDIKEGIKEKVESIKNSLNILYKRGDKKALFAKEGLCDLENNLNSTTEFSIDSQSQVSSELQLKTVNLQLTTDNLLWFYSGDYSDVVGMDIFSGFIKEFIPFFEIFEKGVMMEIRTKSANIQPFLDLGFVPKNTEISLSLNPQDLIEKYEKGTASLDERIESINILLEKGFKVGLRFLPLLPVKDYEKRYCDFIKYISEKIDICKIYSIFASGLLYTKKDYNKILKKYPDLDILHMLELENSDFYRESKKVRDTLYSLFKGLDKSCIFCLEN